MFVPMNLTVSISFPSLSSESTESVVMEVAGESETALSCPEVMSFSSMVSVVVVLDVVKPLMLS